MEELSRERFSGYNESQWWAEESLKGEIMEGISNQDYLRNKQYRNADNLDARMNIHQRFSTNSYGWFRWQFETLGIRAGDMVLDVGCGPASLWVSQREHLPEGVKVVCFDLSQGMVETAAGVLRGDERFEFLCADAQKIPFLGGTFNVVTANHMLYHVPNIDRAASEIRRVLRPDGYLAAATNGLGHMQELHDLVRKIEPNYSPANESATRFGLENGLAALSGAFSKFQVKIYPDSLWVTEIEPLVDYIGSMWGFWGLLTWDEDLKKRTRDELAKEFAATGGFAIRKSSGIILARN
jgi:SAM-dependent methyltransferase